ncbi:MAG TPA: asparagine synthase-related protein [Candidatus Eisenbacteria bacterium]|nr:asparagine synthase-related protein [Candidatus Eisenbacteria bacterium]
MCGIYGIARPDSGGRIDPALLARMEAAFPPPAAPGDPAARRREGDASARWSDGPAGVGAIGHTGRRSGVAKRDVAGQPVVLAFHGSTFSSPADGRARATFDSIAAGILDDYLSAGPGALERIRGDFTVAVWDGRDRSMLVAVDRFRVHSLVYSVTNGSLLFASRLSAILASGELADRTLAAESVVDVIGSSYIPTPRTIYRRVSKLPPGAYLLWKDGRVRSGVYWNLEFRHPSHDGVALLRERVRESFEDAVASRFAAEADPERVGTFLSGGIDSSTVTGVLAKLHPTPIKSFSIGFGEERFNEMGYARIAAKAFGVEHHEYFVQPADVLDTIPRLLDHFDEPFANASAIPTYQCARFAREHGIDVLYAGDGGDELFGGNERYARRAVYAPYLAIPGFVRRGIFAPAAAALAATGHPFFQKAKRFVDRANLPYADRMTSHAFLRVTPVSNVFQETFLRSVDPAYAPYSMMGHYYTEAPANTDLDRELYLDLKLAIGDNDLFKVVRMTEAAGIGVRFPFLDGPFADLSMRVPAKFKMRGAELRTFFKETYADLLPPEVRAKQKHGFGLPIPVWLKSDAALRETMRDLVLGERLRARGIFAPGFLEDLVRRHETDTTSFYGTILWNVMILELWLRRASDGGTG